MPIAFDAIPGDALVPLWWAEIRPAQSPFISPLKVLLLGRAEAAATGARGIPIALSADSAEEMWGRGSMIAHMHETARLNAPLAMIYGVALPEDPGFIAATGKIQVTQTARRDGSCNMLIGGRGINPIIRKTDPKDVIARKIRNAINSKSNLAVKATIDSAHPFEVDLTCKWKGESGNDINIVLSYWSDGYDLAGRIVTVTQLAGGVGEPLMDTSLASLGSEEFDIIVPAAYSHPAKISIYSDFMDGTSGRWSPYQQIYGHIFVGRGGKFADLITYADALNEPHVSVIACDTSPTPMWEWAAGVGAQASLHWVAPPELSRPLQTLPIKNVLAPKQLEKYWDQAERQHLYAYGISGYRIGPNREVLIDRIVTLRKDNAWGSPDPSWRDAITLFQAMFFTRFMRAEITSTYPRAAFTTENSGLPGFASPSQIKNVILQNYLFLQQQGLVENFELFASALEVEKNALDPNRCDALMRIDVVNQLRIVAVAVETHLELTERALATDRSAAAAP